MPTGIFRESVSTFLQLVVACFESYVYVLLLLEKQNKTKQKKQQMYFLCVSFKYILKNEKILTAHVHKFLIFEPRDEEINAEKIIIVTVVNTDFYICKHKVLPEFEPCQCSAQ